MTFNEWWEKTRPTNITKIDAEIIWNAAQKEQCDNSNFWQKNSINSAAEAKYYQNELEKAHALIGRIVHQLSERWDSVNLTKYFPTNNLHKDKTINNPEGKK